MGICRCLELSVLCHGRHVKQSGLSEEQRFDLERVVAVVGSGIERQVHRPCLEGIAVDPEAEVACQRCEERLFP